MDTSQLESKRAPASLKKHTDLFINDKLVCDQTYIEEYYGIHTSSKTWDYITEVEYKVLRPII